MTLNKQLELSKWNTSVIICKPQEQEQEQNITCKSLVLLGTADNLKYLITQHLYHPWQVRLTEFCCTSNDVSSVQLIIMQGLSSQNSDVAYSNLLANPTAYTMKMKVPSSFHTSVTIYHSTECHIPEDLNLHAQNYFVYCDFVPNPEYYSLTHF
jgi:hypothetical protein